MYYYNTMIYSALVGNPTEHSVSPVLFEWIAARLPDPLEYKHLKIDVPTVGDLGKYKEALHALGFCGLNVTLPYKTAMLPHLDEVDESVRDIGAVNTITLRDDGAKGYNTDWKGLFIPLSNLEKPLALNHATIFGAGGAARAAVYACRQLGVRHIAVADRSIGQEKREQIVDDFSKYSNVSFHNYDDVHELVDNSDLVINATSTGMVGNDKSPFPLATLDGIEMSNKVFYDCVFNPVKTPMLDYFAGNGSRTIDGLWMMTHQALYAFSLWTGVDVTQQFTDDDLNQLHGVLESHIS